MNYISRFCCLLSSVFNLCAHATAADISFRIDSLSHLSPDKLPHINFCFVFIFELYAHVSCILVPQVPFTHLLPLCHALFLLFYSLPRSARRRVLEERKQRMGQQLPQNLCNHPRH